MGNLGDFDITASAGVVNCGEFAICGVRALICVGGRNLGLEVGIPILGGVFSRNEASESEGEKSNLFRCNSGYRS